MTDFAVLILRITFLPPTVARQFHRITDAPAPAAATTTAGPAR